jgi:hypothetical protein
MQLKEDQDTLNNEIYKRNQLSYQFVKEQEHILNDKKNQIHEHKKALAQ